MNKKKIIYILSSSHSGSTLLDMLISKHKDIVGLGEVYSFLINKEKNLEETESTCSCGKDSKNCPIWSEYKIKTDSLDKNDYLNKYKEVIKVIDSYEKNIFVDSSKKTWILEILKEIEKEGLIDLKVVFLIRDVRGWATSFSWLGKKTKKMKKPFLYGIYKWYIDNKKYKRFLNENNFKYIQISYENLVFDTENTVKELLDFSEIDSSNFKLTDSPNTHIAYGNRTKHDKGDVVYDARWMHQYWNNFFLILTPHIFLWNKKNVSLPKYKR